MNRCSGLLWACLALSASGQEDAGAVRVTFFAKHQQHLREQLVERFHEVSDPRHERYGLHLSLDAVTEFQRPRSEHVAAVREHLQSLGGIEVAASRAEDKIVALVPTSRLSGHEFPAHVLAAIDTVSGLKKVQSRLSEPRSTRRTPKQWKTSVNASSEDPQKCLAERAVPPCIREAYGLGDLTGSASSNGQAVIVNQGYKMSDLESFCQEYKLTSCVDSIHEVGSNTGEAGDEASLDIQYISATGQGVPLWWVYIDGHTANPFSDWITWASNTSGIPFVHSLSVGEPEDEFAHDNGAGEVAVERMNHEMMAMGARGISIIFASGDSGYNAAQKYGSSSPYVTSVGGVFNGELGDDVLQVDDISTGGFSSLNTNAIQPWQKDAVNAYLGTKGARPSDFNSSRRCCPDLSIYDAGYYIVQGGSDSPIGGTSAAAPTFAGMISLINDALISAKKPTLGFLNYFLYQNQAAFLDITKGGNNGFDATVGYDPASGLGTFSPTTFSKLKAAALAKHAVPSQATPATDNSPKLLVGLRHSASSRGALERRFWAAAEPERQEPLVTGPAQIADIVRADSAVVQAAEDWLRSIGADLATLRLVPTGDALAVEWPAGAGLRQAPKPPASSSFSDYVLLLDARPLSEGQPKATKNVKYGVKARDDSMGPAAQKAAYGVPASLKGVSKSNSQMVFGTGTFGYREEDLKMFFSQYATTSSVEDISFDKSNLWKGETGKNFVEGELDASYIAAFAPGVKTLVANTNVSAATEGGEGFGAALLSFLVELNGRDEVPLVLSMSLGSLSFGACDKVCSAISKKGHTYQDCWGYMQTQFQVCMFESAAIEQRIDAELAKLGLRGVTVTAAAGDGASHFAFGPFSGGIGDELNSLICSEMVMPVYPACSPYVLSVGGTQWASDDMYGPACSATAPCGWTDGGGGFSWQHARPPYQNATTDKYVALGNKVAPKTMAPASNFNAAGRGYPDLSALAAFGIPLCTYGGCSGSGGTSASAPTVAGMISLINDERLGKGLKPLGFINTRLYALMEDPSIYAECFVDVGIEKVGSEWDCSTYSSCDGCQDGGGAGKGFVATKGWDAQTGFGQPKFDGLLKHLGSDSSRASASVYV